MGAKTAKEHGDEWFYRLRNSRWKANAIIQIEEKPVKSDKERIILPVVAKSLKFSCAE